MSESYESAHKHLVTKARSEPSFKQALLEDPNAAIAQEIGVEVPEGIKVHVLEETPSDIYLVIPAAPSGDATLSDTELATVAGGSGAYTGCGWGLTCGGGSAWGSCG